MDSYELSLVCAKDKSNKSWGFARASELFHAHEKVIMFISAEGKKNLSLGKKKKFKKKEAWRQEPHGTPEERGTGTKSTKPSPAEPQPETAPGNPFPLLQSIKRKWKPTRSRDGFIKPPQKLNCSWEPLFFPPRSEEFSSDRKDDFSCVHHP